MGLLKRLLSSSADEVQADAPHHVVPAEANPVQVVGESYYDDALDRICGGRREGGHERYCHAVLRRQPDNPYDANAVGVIIEGELVGHLSRDDAAAYAAELDNNGTAELLVDAVIRGGWNRGGGDTGHYGVTLNLPAAAELFAETPTAVARSSRDGPSSRLAGPAKLAPGGTVTVTGEEDFQPEIEAAARELVFDERGVASTEVVLSLAGDRLIVSRAGSTLGALTSKMSARYGPFVDSSSTGEVACHATIFRSDKAAAPLQVELNAVPRMANQSNIAGLDVKVTSEIVLNRRSRTVHRLAAAEGTSSGSARSICGVEFPLNDCDLVGRTRPWVGYVWLSSGAVIESIDEVGVRCDRC